MTRTAVSHRRWWVMALSVATLGRAVLGLELEATTVVRLNLEQMVRGSQRIIIGRCLSRRTHWNRTRTLILTSTRFAVTEDLKGESRGFATVVMVGGTKDGITQEVSGVPKFEVGEEVLLFLTAGKSGRWRPLGLSQGKFRIVTDRQGIRQALHASSGLHFSRASAGESSKAPIPARIEIDRLLSRIRQLINSGGE